MSNVSITKAAELAGVSRTTLYSDMKTGKVTYKTEGKNRRTINVAELERVYGSLHIKGAKEVTSSVKSEQNNLTIEKSELVELAILRERVDRLNDINETNIERIAFLEAALDKAQSNSELLLEDKRHVEVKEEGWERSIKALEQRISNHEQSAKEEKERAQKILRQNNALKKALATEKEKSWVQKLFGS